MTTTASAWDALRAILPDTAKDLRLNVRLIESPARLSALQAAGSALTAAITSRNERVIAAVESAVAGVLDDETRGSAHAAAAIMGMNNVYYRFAHSVSDPEYMKAPAGLRMQVLAKPGVERGTFELWCLVASAINGCAMCMDSHRRTLEQEGVPKEAILEAVRIGAVIHGAAVAAAPQRA